MDFQVEKEYNGGAYYLKKFFKLLYNKNVISKVEGGLSDYTSIYAFEEHKPLKGEPNLNYFLGVHQTTRYLNLKSYDCSNVVQGSNSDSSLS